MSKILGCIFILHHTIWPVCAVDTFLEEGFRLSVKMCFKTFKPLSAMLNVDLSVGNVFLNHLMSTFQWFIYLMEVFGIFLPNFLFLPDFVPDSKKFIESRTMADFVKRKLVQRPIPEKNISHFGTLPDNTKKMEGNCSQIFCWCHSQVITFLLQSIWWYTNQTFLSSKF